MSRLRPFVFVLLAVAAAFALAGPTGILAPASAQDAPAGEDAPEPGKGVVTFEVALSFDPGGDALDPAPTGLPVHAAVKLLIDGELDPTKTGSVSVAGLAAEDGTSPLALELAGGQAGAEKVTATGAPIVVTWGAVEEAAGPRTFGGWLSLLPPILALVLALATRQVLPALFGGVWLGATIHAGGPITGLLRALDGLLVNALADSGHASIIIFTSFLGGMTAVIARSGGTHGVVDAVAPIATTPRRGLLATWTLGLLVFFDDYANTLIVGPTMRPVTDRLRVSREKLAYVVDSTAAPIAALALISTWIGTELSYIEEGYADLGIETEPFAIFVYALPARFYSIFAIAIVFLTIVLRRDIGPMAAAEARAARGDGVIRKGAQPAGGRDIDEMAPPPGKPRRWPNAVLPILTVVVVTIVGLFVTGWGFEPEPGTGFFGTILGIIGSSDSYKALTWASFLGAALAIALASVQRILSLGEALEAFMTGVKAMVPAFAILVLAWALGAVCADQLHTGRWVADALGGKLPPALFPAITFVACAGISFATGTSWGTMGLMLPLSIAVAGRLVGADGAEIDPYDPVLLGTIVAVLDGAIFGDHCSPISDTTVLSSMASNSDHIDHVKTQLPYALLGAVLALVLGYLPYAVIGLPIVPVGFLVAMAITTGVLLGAGKTRPDLDGGAAAETAAPAAG